METDKKMLLEAGKVVSTHGIHGTLRVEPWSDKPDFLKGFSRVFIDGNELRLKSAAPHKNLVLCTLEGVESLDEAEKLRGKIICIDRRDAELPEGRHFVQDLVGMRVEDKKLGNIGVLREVIDLPAGNVYVVKGEKEYLIPAVDEFIKKIDMENRLIEVETIEGMSGEG